MNFIALIESDGTILSSWDTELRWSLCVASAAKSAMTQHYVSDICQPGIDKRNNTHICYPCL